MELEVDRGLDWEHALTRFNNYKEASPMTGFYLSKRDMFGTKLSILVTPKDNSSHIFHVARSVCVCHGVCVCARALHMHFFFFIHWREKN